MQVVLFENSLEVYLKDLYFDGGVFWDNLFLCGFEFWERPGAEDYVEALLCECEGECFADTFITLYDYLKRSLSQMPTNFTRSDALGFSFSSVPVCKTCITVLGFSWALQRARWTWSLHRTLGVFAIECFQGPKKYPSLKLLSIIIKSNCYYFTIKLSE
mgnify:CR=1 FL=1